MSVYVCFVLNIGCVSGSLRSRVEKWNHQMLA